jgi:Flp pilus assembly protein TadD
VAAGLAVLVAGVLVLGLPYLSVREVSLASNTRFTDPAAALADLDRAAQLNPLDATPGRLAGAIALQMGQYGVAEQRFRQSISREPGGWFAWLGAGVAASALGRTPVAMRDFRVAYGINSRQPVISTALARARSFHPLTYDEMLKLLVLVH